jgi:hypothetical protein
MVSTDHLRQELVAQLGRAAQAGRINVLINSAELSRSIRATSSAPLASDAMQAEIRPGDTVLT